MGELLAGRHALVTGASRGIGLASATRLAEAGARVTLVARRPDALAAAVARIGASASLYVCDVTHPEAVAAMADAVPAPDILVNNAGIFEVAPLASTAPEVFARTIAINLTAPFLVLRAFLPAMQVRGTGHLLAISSIADRVIYPGNGAYTASKFGHRAMHEVLREELRGTGVRSTLIAPAATDTTLWDPIQPETRPGFPSRSAMLRAEDVADAVLWAATRPAHVNIDELRLSFR